MRGFKSLHLRQKKDGLLCKPSFFWRKFATQTYPAREFKSRGNPAKGFPANIPFLAGDGKFSIFSAIQGTSERSMKPFVMGRKNKRDKAGGSLTRQPWALYAVEIDDCI